jgi:hypothetical protein
MGPAQAPSLPAFPSLDPIIMDDDMESTFRNANMDFLDPTNLEMSTESAGGDFDDLFARATTSRPNGASGPSKPYQDQNPLRQVSAFAADSPVESPDGSSRSSSSESPRNHVRQTSIASTNSAAHSETPMVSINYSDDWMRPELSSVKEESPFNIEPSFPMDGGFSMDPDLEVSNKAMDAAFDFESAASSPSPLKSDHASLPRPQKRPKSQLWSPSSNHAGLSSDAAPSVSHRIPAFVETMLICPRLIRRDPRSSLLDSMASHRTQTTCIMIWKGRFRNGVDSRLHRF